MASLAQYIETQRAKKKKRRNLLGETSLPDGDLLATDDDFAPEAPIAPEDESPIEALKLDSETVAPEAPVEEAPADVGADLGFSEEAPAENPEAQPSSQNFSDEELAEGEISASNPNVMDSEETAADKSRYNKYIKAAPGITPVTFKRSNDELAGLIEEIPSPVDREKFERQRAGLQASYEAARSSNEWGQVADLIGQGLVRLGAGLYGMKHGVDVSGVKFNSFDWEKRLDGLRKNLDSDLAGSFKQEATDLDVRDKAIGKARQNINDTQAEELALQKEGRDIEGEKRSEIKFINEQDMENPDAPMAEGIRGIIMKSDKKGLFPKEYLDLMPPRILLSLQNEILNPKFDMEAWMAKQKVLLQHGLIKQENQQGHITGRADNSGIRHFVNQFENDVQIKKVKEQVSALSSMDELLGQADKGNQLAFGQLRAQLSRLAGHVGVLTEFDVTSSSEGQTYLRKLSDTTRRKLYDGQVSDASLDDMKSIISAYKEIIPRRVNPIKERYVNQAYERHGKKQGRTKDQVFNDFGGDIYPSQFPREVFNSKTGESAHVSNEAELKEANDAGFR